MLTCKQVSKALADQDYATLSCPRKLALRLHVALCFICGRYNRQMMDLYDGLRGYRAHEDQLAPHDPGGGLNDAQKQRLKEAVGAGLPT